MLQPQPGTAGERYVCFRLADQEFGVRIADVKETIQPRPVTRVFRTPPVVLGLMNLRGEVVAVLDVAPLLGLPRTTLGPDKRFVVARRGARGPKAGILVDSLSEVRVLAPDDLRPPPATLDPAVAGFLAGVASFEAGPVSLIDLERVFDCEALSPFRGAS